jgi:hypothetical protein
MKAKRALIPGALDTLEDRLVLSHVGSFSPALAVHPHIHMAANTLPPISINRLSLNGTLTGSFTNGPSPQSSAPTLLTILKGSGLVSPIGKVDVSGSLTTSTTQAPTTLGPQGTVTLSNSQGSVTLRLSVPVGQVYSRLSMRFEFSIVKGTGAFAGGAGTGSADLTLIPQGGPVSSNGISQGSFALSLHSSPPIV